MMPFVRKYLYHILAILTVAIWGTTFVSTKILIEEGLSPAEIMVYRFLIAYIGIWLCFPRRLFANSIKDELLCVAIGLFAGSLYFFLENTALEITLASNVSLIICTAPILTALLNRLFYRQERLTNHLIMGSIIALIGVSFVIFNGSYIIKISPVGDILTILASLSWAAYTIIIRKLNSKYSTLFLTRKIFFYGVLTMLPIMLTGDGMFNPHLITGSITVWGNILYLGLFASLACYITWNMAIKELGVVQVSNYIYLNPIVTLATSAIIIHEPITPIAITGAFITLAGVYVAEKGGRFFKKKRAA